MKLTCAIIDDEPLAVELLESYVRKTPFLELKGAYNGGITALEALKTEPVDLLFCDIQMPELSGMELSRMLPTRTRVVFTTASTDTPSKDSAWVRWTTCSSRSAMPTS